MLTIFSLPKAFAGHVAVIQRNALASWRSLSPGVEVLLVGDDPGTAEVAAEHGVRHVSGVATNDRGTPRLDDAFRLARRAARHELLCYVNADIVLTPSLLASVAVAAAGLRRFLLSGRRTNLDVTEPCAFVPGVEPPDLSARARREGILGPSWALDYFVFPRDDALGSLPLPLVVGRAGWDLWFAHRAVALGVPVIDATADVLAIHQNHGYEHVACGAGASWEGPESARQLERIGRRQRCLAGAATLRLAGGSLRPAWGREYRKARTSWVRRTQPKLLRLLVSRTVTSHLCWLGTAASACRVLLARWFARSRLSRELR